MTDMERSFYQFLMTQRDPHLKDELTQFANAASKDLQFPKHSADFDEISGYLELNASYLPSMAIFDQAWQLYLDNSR